MIPPFTLVLSEFVPRPETMANFTLAGADANLDAQARVAHGISSAMDHTVVPDEENQNIE